MKILSIFVCLVFAALDASAITNLYQGRVLTIGTYLESSPVTGTLTTNSVVIDNSANSISLDNYQVPITFTNTSGMAVDLSDLRFYDSTSELSYWIENASLPAKVWVKVPVLPARSMATIQMSYGTSRATASDGSAVFPLFDDFSATGIENWVDMARVDRQVVLDRTNYFMCMLADTEGRTVITNSEAELLWVGKPGGVETAYRAKMNVDTLAIGASNVVKTLDAGSTWASPHLAIKVTNDFYFLMYSAYVLANGRSIRIATNSTLDSTFTRYGTVDVLSSAAWETNTSPWLETGVRYIKWSESATNLNFWIGSEHPVGQGLMGWVNLELDKVARSFTVIGNYTNNPLTNLLIGASTRAYAGGNMDQTDLGLGTSNMMIYQSFDGLTFSSTMAISTNKFFDTVNYKTLLEPATVYANQLESEKFQWYVRTNTMFLLYEVQSPTGSIAAYKYVPGRPVSSIWTNGYAVRAKVAAGGLNVVGLEASSALAFVRSTNSFGTNKALRFSAKVVNPNAWEEVGFRDGSFVGYGTTLMFRTNGTIRLSSLNTLGNTLVDIPNAFGAERQTYELARTLTNVSLSINDTNVVSTNGNVSSSAFSLMLSGMNGATNVFPYSSTREWALVRDYIDTEPSVTVGGATTNTPFWPTNISGCKVWIAADTLSLADGADVTGLADLASGYSVTNVSGSMPIFTNSIAEFNSKPGIYFSGSKWLVIDGAKHVCRTNNGTTLFAVFRPRVIPGSSSAPVFAFETGTAGATRLGIFSPNGATNTLGLIARQSDADSGQVLASSADTATTYVFSGTVDYASNVMNQWTNGVSAGTMTGTFAAGTATSDTASASVRLGRLGTSTAYFQGWIAEVIIYDKVLSDGARLAVETYLNAKYK